MSTPIRTCILGFGRNGSTMHAKPLAKYTDLFEVVAICDIDPDSREKARKDFNCPIYDDYHKMLAEVKPELTVIVTRSSQHAQMAIDCMQAGSNVLVTKPWATNEYDALRMVATAEVTGKKLLPWLPARFGADLKKLREILDAGTIGKVFEIRRSECTFGMRYDWQTESKFGGGYLLNWGPHLVDQPLSLVTSPVKRVYGSLRQIINPGDVEDNLRVICHLENGCTVVSEYLIAAGEYPNWVIQGDRGTIYVVGDKITVHRIKFPETADVTAYRGNVERTEHTETCTGTRYGDEFEVYPHIAAALRDEEPYFATLEEGLRLSKVLDAARRSSATGQEIIL